MLHFFETSTGNLLDAEAAEGVAHHVALSVVGTERLSESGYFRAKIAQEKLIQESSIPYSIVHATQFFEFIKSIADAATDGNTVRLAPVPIQPMAADDVASAVGRIALDSPVNGIVEVAGPEQFRLDELIRRSLDAQNDPRQVIADPHARYFGAQLKERTLIPGDGAILAETRFEDWLSRATAQSDTAEPEGSVSSVAAPIVASLLITRYLLDAPRRTPPVLDEGVPSKSGSQRLIGVDRTGSLKRARTASCAPLPSNRKMTSLSLKKMVCRSK